MSFTKSAILTSDGILHCPCGKASKAKPRNKLGLHKCASCGRSFKLKPAVTQQKMVEVKA